ncbi:MAG TPA: PilZ domain-containing protein [Pseudobdellovibrionaceae bacterium]|nr:PilZ domain-containing protein [Pseudobdellovibrionaceae bacterium]
MDDKYYIFKNNKITGPMDSAIVLKMIENLDLQWLDKASLKEIKDYQVPSLGQAKPLLCFPNLSRYLTENLKPGYGRSTATAQSLGHFLDRQWFIFRSNMPLGPFSKLELIQMLQEKALDSESYIWAYGSNQWKKIYEWSEFSSAEIANLRQSNNSEVHRVFYKRKHPRAQFGCSLIVNDEKKMFHGAALEISEGGVGIKLSKSNFNVGHRIFLHFKSGEGVPAFNAVGEIVSRHHLGLNADLEARYGVKFLNVSNHVKDSIRTYTATQVSS